MADPPKTRLRVAKTVGVAKGVVQFFIIPERVDGFAWTDVRSFAISGAPKGAPTIATATAHGAHASADQLQA